MSTRRAFFQDVAGGAIIAGVGGTMALPYRVMATEVDQGPPPLNFGPWESLVGFIQETPADKIIAKAIEKLREGVTLEDLVCATSLANARAFGGEDYIGFHTLMALAPAYRMAMEDPNPTTRPLALLKILHRNASRLHESGCSERNNLTALNQAASGDGTSLREQVRACNLAAAESTLNGICRQNPNQAMDELMVMVDDATEVHRVVMVARSMDLVDFVGVGRANSLLRQSIHYCVKAEKQTSYANIFKDVRDLLPKILSENKLLERKLGNRAVDSDWVDRFCQTLFSSTPAQAAQAAGAALAEGILPDAIAEAVSLAANQLVLRDRGRPAKQAQPNKPVGSVHGDSIGVHASDSANAWRAIARRGNDRTKATSAILGAHQVARDRLERGGDFAAWTPYPAATAMEEAQKLAPTALLGALEEAIKGKDQNRAAACVAAMDPATSKCDTKAVFAMLRKYAISEDGALHGEKYYRTVVEDMALSHPGLAWRHAIGLAKVTASAYGQPAAGVSEAKERLAKV